MEHKCVVCFNNQGQRMTPYECIFDNTNRMINQLVLTTCPTCDFYYDFYPEDLIGNNVNDIINNLQEVVAKNKIKEANCYICCNNDADYISLDWSESIDGKIYLRMCNECRDGLPVNLVVKGNIFEQALLFIKRSLEI